MLPRCIAIGLLASILCASDAAASGKTTREKNELIGPVRSVVTMTADASSSETYDRAGNLTEAIVYQREEKHSTRYVFTYDQRGELQEEIAYEADGTPLYRRLFAYAQDPSGRATAVVAASQEGEFHHAELSIYDGDGNLAEKIYTDGTMTSRNLFDVLGRILYSGRYRDQLLLAELAWTYDNNGRLIGLTSYSPGGAVTGKVRHEYDDTGKRIRTTTETIQHGATSRWISTYEYDGAGNWIKELTRQVTGSSSESGTAPSQLLQERLIDYYETR
ncbi:hypothetical protein ACO9S2_12900 [Nitrospira sp. NS4]|uniref:hypothetical protein n=1 Tax=Nitrospira sp. NS4 TaxID=3414498 RepID=UPI003C2EF4C0